MRKNDFGVWDPAGGGVTSIHHHHLLEGSGKYCTSGVSPRQIPDYAYGLTATVGLASPITPGAVVYACLLGGTGN